MIISIDFEGTCTEYSFPKIGKSIGAEPFLRTLIANGHKLILSTLRCHPDGFSMLSRDGLIIESDTLNDAIQWFKDRDIPLFNVNSNPNQKSWTNSPKIFADFYIDDLNIGSPLICEPNKKPYLDWVNMSTLLVQKNLISRKQQLECLKLI